jgi:eukaryotic-like serine/threonine-protein kinase
MSAGGLLAGRYELEELLGQGGMARVYRALDHDLGRHVAVKILEPHLRDDPDAVARFRDEARRVAGLVHPNLVTVIDRGATDDVEFMVLELVPGETLKALLRRRGTLLPAEAVAIARDIAAGLGAAHERGVVHRDVKPQNVLLHTSGVAKITDFGVAGDGRPEARLFGTCDYLAPEQVRGERVDSRADIYALGAVLYELLAGSVVFPGSSFEEVARRHATEVAPDVRARRPAVSSELAEVVACALAKEPARRFPTMAALIAALDACPEGAASEEASPRIERDSVLDWPVLLLIGGIVAAVATIAAVMFTGGGGGSSVTSGTTVRLPPTSAVRAIGAYDPFGDGTEHDSTAPLATDGKLATFWQTSRYTFPNGGLGKPGVGLVFDAGSHKALEELTVETLTPGFEAVIRVSDDPTSFTTDDSATFTAARSTLVQLDGHHARYYLLWITRLPAGGVVKIAEVG